ncbi:MAG: glycosyltransferase family 4 protein [Patescibacteria group bacterium]
MKVLSNEYLSNLPSGSNVAPGGPANFARPFSNFITKHGHEWIGIIHQGNNANKTTLRKKASSPGKTFFILSFSYEHYRSFLNLEKRCDARVWFAPQIKRIRSFIRRMEPDVLFLNGFSVYAWLLLEAAKQEHLPIAIQHAGIAKIEFTQYKHLYSKTGRAMVLQMEQDIVDAASKQIFLNDFSREVFCKKVAPVPKKQSIIIPLPYQESFLRSADLYRAREKNKTETINIGCVARWDRIKNHRAILRVAREAKKQKLPWKFTSVTRIPQTPIDLHFKQSYRKNIEVMLPMEQKALIPFYESMDLFVLPSHFDVSPTVVMEAALFGKKTLISPNVGWVSEYRSSGLRNWIIDFSDAKKVVDRIKKLLKKQANSNFRSIIRNRHSPDKIFSKYLQIFKSII